MKFKEMIIDLTPLLDVILILLFMVIASTSQVTNDQITELEEEIQELQLNQQAVTDSEKLWYQSFQESIGKVNIIMESSLKLDATYIVLEDGSKLQNDANEDLANWIRSIVTQVEKEVVIVAFSYNNDKIYLRDYRSMVALITQLDEELDKTIVYQEEQIHN